MSTKTKILILENDANDIDFIRCELQKSGINYTWEIVQNKQGFKHALKNFIPDVILSDYSLPGFDGSEAFEVKEALTPDTPFILVSGTIGEEKAVELIKGGVTDYVLKDKLFTLPPKIVRALKEAKEKKEKTITDEKLYKANNLYSFISQVNQNIVRVKDEATLFRNSCQLAIEFGKFKIAWIGMYDYENKIISLVEQCGLNAEDTNLLSNIPYQSGGPQDYVIRSGKYFVSNNAQNDPLLINWKPFAAKFGINSCMVLPLKKSGKIVGSFNLYSSEFNFTNEEETGLLLEATNDISFALNLFEKEKKQIETEELVIKNEKRFRALIEKSTDMKTLSTLEGNFIYGSPSIEKILGYSPEEVLQQNIFGFTHPDDLAGFLEKRKELLQTSNKPFYVQVRFKHKNGSWIWCEGTITNLLNEPAVQALVANFRDISERKETEELRIFEENNLQALINNTHDLMWSVDKDFNLITSNRPFDEMGKINFGKSIGKAGNVLSTTYSPEMLGHFKQLYERAFAGESFTAIEYFDSPVELWSEISYYPIRKGDEVIGTACHSRDITQTKIAERQLRKSEAFNSGILNSLSSHIAVLDSAGIIVAVNESWKRFALENGATTLLACAEGANYYTVCETSGDKGIKEAVEVLKGIKDVMNGNKVSFYLEYPCHSPDEKRWFGMRVLKFDSKEPMAVVAHQNITERKLAEENLVHSEARLKEAQAISHTGNWEIDFVRNIHTWSDEMYVIFGIKKEEVQPSTELFLSFVHPEEIDEIKTKVKGAFTSLKATSYNFRFIRKDGTIRYGYTERKFEFDKNNKPTRLLGVVQDITDRKLIEEEREKMINNIVQHSKNLEQFASIVSHNLRAPVANILGLSNVLKTEISKEDRTRTQEFLFRATYQLDDVLKDMVKILQARSEINEYKEIVNLDELVNVIKSSIHNIIEKEMVQITTDFTAIESVTTIKSYLHSIFYNLISNSIKYRQPGKAPLIIIKSWLKKGKIKISFKDNGMGIDLASHGEKIFGLYKRFHLNIEGKGLGLFMVKTQVETLGGTIRVESKEGEGAEFIIELPL